MSEVIQSCLTRCALWTCSPPDSCPWDFPGKNTGVGWHFLLQGIFLTPAFHIAGRHFNIWATREAIKCHQNHWDKTLRLGSKGENPTPLGFVFYFSFQHGFELNFKKWWLDSALDEGYISKKHCGMFNYETRGITSVAFWGQGSCKCYSCLKEKLEKLQILMSCACTFSCVWLCDPMDCSPPGRFLCPWNFPGKNAAVGCHFLFQILIPIIKVFN